MIVDSDGNVIEITIPLGMSDRWREAKVPTDLTEMQFNLLIRLLELYKPVIVKKASIEVPT